MFFEIQKKIEAYDTIIIHRHENPDGDALGSQIGLATLLRENYPEKKIYIVGARSSGAISFIFGNILIASPPL